MRSSLSLPIVQVAARVRATPSRFASSPTSPAGGGWSFGAAGEVFCSKERPCCSAIEVFLPDVPLVMLDGWLLGELVIELVPILDGAGILPAHLAGVPGNDRCLVVDGIDIEQRAGLKIEA